MADKTTASEQRSSLMNIEMLECVTPAVAESRELRHKSKAAREKCERIRRECADLRIKVHTARGVTDYDPDDNQLQQFHR